MARGTKVFPVYKYIVLCVYESGAHEMQENNFIECIRISKFSWIGKNLAQTSSHTFNVTSNDRNPSQCGTVKVYSMETMEQSVFLFFFLWKQNKKWKIERKKNKCIDSGKNYTNFYAF